MMCILKQLKSSKQEEWLPFLTLENGEPIPNKKDFSCCAGNGYYLLNEESFSVNSCELKKRLAKIRILLDCFEKTWGKPCQPPELETKEFRLYWNWLIHYTHRLVYKGYFLRDTTSYKAWALALMGIWRLGLDCFVYNLKKHPITDFLAYISQFDASLSPVIFLEVEDGFQNLQKREELSYMISWCEKHLAPLWIINQTNEEKKSFLTYDNRILNMFQSRIQKTEAKPFIKNLEQDSLSKLSTLCIMKTDHH